MGELIRTLEFAPQTRKLKRPLHTSAGVLRELPGVQVLCATRHAAAVGEAPLLDAAPVPGVMRALAGARAWLCGMDAAAARALLDARVHSAPAAWALDTALAGLARTAAHAEAHAETHAASAPAVHVAPAARLKVRTAALAFARRPAELEAEVAELVAEGEHTIKIKIGMGTMADDLELAHAARSAAGAEVALRLDANGAWDEDEARRRIRALAAVRPEFIEQPVSGPGPAALARLRRAAAVPIAADESARDAEGARRVLAAEAADVLVLKPAALGSFRRARALAAEAQDSAVDVVLSSLFDGACSLTAALRLAAELNLSRVQGLGTGNNMLAPPHHHAPAGGRAGAGTSAAPGGNVAPTVAPNAATGDAPNVAPGFATDDAPNVATGAAAAAAAARLQPPDLPEFPDLPEMPLAVAGVVEFCA